MTPGAAGAHALGAVTAGGLIAQAASASGDGLWPWGVPILLLSLTTVFAGWLIAWRRPETRLGWILLAIPLLFALQGAMSALGGALAPIAPAVAAWVLEFGADSQWTWIPPIGLMLTQLPLRFPTGRLPSPGWRAFSRSTIALLVLGSLLTATLLPETARGVPNPVFVDWGRSTDLVSAASTLVLVPAVLGSLASLFVRHRRAGAVERAQLRWFFWAIAVVVLLLVGGWIAVPPLHAVLPASSLDWLTVVVGLSYSLIPVSVLFAVLRRGLFSIDRIISRTAAYLLVSIAVVAVYATVVLTASFVVPRLAGVGVALATLAAAGLFLPLLRVVRRTVDRVFDRPRYDAERVVAAYGEHVRTGADPHAAGTELLRAVERTLQPASVGLWMRR